MKKTKLEEEFNLPPIENVEIPLEDEEEEELSIEEIQDNIEEVSQEITIADKIDTALPVVIGLEQLDKEMDDYADQAMKTFEDLCDLGKNVEDRHAAPIYDSASKMISAALQAKQAKMDKKLKMIELQMRKRKLDLDTRKVDASLKDKEGDPEEIEGKFLGDRTSMLSEIVAKMKENDK